jgi:hypothetical protein
MAERKPELRSVFRWLAAISCPFFVVAAAVTAFPQIIGGSNQPSFVLAVLLLWGGMLFGSIAATGRFKR